MVVPDPAPQPAQPGDAVAGVPWARTLAVAFYILAFAAMVAGMVGKAYYDYLTKHQAKFQPEQILIPLTVSPIVFGLILSAVRTSETLPAIILAFQNGFFCQDIFNGIKAPSSGSGQG